jgi:hypothetical protein
LQTNWKYIPANIRDPPHSYASGGTLMARPEHTGRKPPTGSDDADADAFSITEFCRRHGISPQLFYKFRKEMPATFNVGTRVLISKEAAAKWRRDRAAASAERRTT